LTTVWMQIISVSWDLKFEQFRGKLHRKGFSHTNIISAVLWIQINQNVHVCYLIALLSTFGPHEQDVLTVLVAYDNTYLIAWSFLRVLHYLWCVHRLRSGNDTESHSNKKKIISKIWRRQNWLAQNLLGVLSHFCCSWKQNACLTYAQEWLRLPNNLCKN